MKKRDLKNLRNKTVEELKNELSNLTRKRIEVQVKIISGKEKNLKAVSNLRRDIARVATLIREKQK